MDSIKSVSGNVFSAFFVRRKFHQALQAKLPFWKVPTKRINSGLTGLLKMAPTTTKARFLAQGTSHVERCMAEEHVCVKAT